MTPHVAMKVQSGLILLSSMGLPRGTSQELASLRTPHVLLRVEAMPSWSRRAFSGIRCTSPSSSSSSEFDQEDGSEISSSLSKARRNFPPQEALLQAVTEASKLEGRTAKTTNVVMGGTSVYGSDWLELDKKVNTYPSYRSYTAIGEGGDDFVNSMVVAVESVMDARISEWQVSQRASTRGRYISVRIGPLRMESSDQVKAVYEAMKEDARMKYFL